jgi:hypothetical protein
LNNNKGASLVLKNNDGQQKEEEWGGVATPISSFFSEIN